MQTLTASPRYAGLRVSPDAYFQLEDDGFRYDMIHGVLQLSSSGTADHNRKLNRFYFALESYLRMHRAGEAFTELDIQLPDGDDVLRPDVSFVLNENAHIVEDWIRGVPDLVCEVLSPSSRGRDLVDKARRYLRNGVREYWIIEDVQRQMERRYNVGDAWHVESGDVVTSRLLPGFAVTVDEIFTARR